MIKTAAWIIAEAYKGIVGKCDKCSNEVLYNDTEDTPVVSCPICGKRWYMTDSMIKGVADAYGIK